MILPPLWYVAEEYEDTVVIHFTDAMPPLIHLLVFFGESEEDISLSEFIVVLCQQLSANYSDNNIDNDEEITLSDSTTAQQVLVTCKNKTGSTHQSQVLYIQNGSNYLAFWAVPSWFPQLTSTQLEELNTLYSSITLNR